MPQLMSFDMDPRKDDVSLPVHRNQDILNDVNPSPKPHKAMDVFEFNDPSPPLPPAILSEEKIKKIPTPRASPSAASPFGLLDKRVTDIELPSKIDASSSNATSSLSMLQMNSSSKGSYDKPKSEKKKKRKRESAEGGSPTIAKKKSSDSLNGSPSKKSSSSSSSSSQLMGKPASANLKPSKSPVTSSHDTLDDLSFLNFAAEQQTLTVPSPPLSSPQSLLKTSSSTQPNRKHSLSAVINKLKSEMSDALPGGDEKKSEYMIKSSGSDGIKITFNKTKSSKGLKSPKHTGLKPGVNSGPASKKSSSQSSKSSSQKLLYQKSSSSSSLVGSSSSSSSTIPSPKSSSQPGKSSSSSKDKLKDGSSMFSSFASGYSNDMLKSMLNQASLAPVTFDKKFQIPKLSARSSKPENEKAAFDEASNFNAMHPRSAPATPSPSMEGQLSINPNQYQMTQQKSFANTQQPNKINDQQNRNKKLFKSVSSEQLFNETIEKLTNNSDEINSADFQAFLRAQSRLKDSSVSMQISQNPMRNNVSSQQSMESALNEGDLLDLNFIGNEM